MRARFPGRGAGWPWGLLGMLAMVLAVERAVDRDSTRFLTPFELDWKTAGQEATREAKGAEVLCFGDSMVKFGVSPRVLEAELGRPTHSLALLDGKPPASYFLLRRALEAGARPKVVLVDFQPECMLETPHHMLEKQHWPALLSLREDWDLLRTHRDPDFFARTAIARLLPTVQSRLELRSELLAALGSKPASNAWENAKVWRNRRRNHGGMLLARKPRYAGQVPPEVLKDTVVADWFHRPENTAYVRGFMALAEAHGIPVVWVLPPNVPRIEEARREAGQEGRYTRFVRGVQARYPGLHVADGRASGFDHTWFVDPVHLDREGAAAFTRGVAEVLRKVLDGPAPRNLWASVAVDRPATRPGVPGDLEDVDQTGQALAASVTGVSVRR